MQLVKIFLITTIIAFIPVLALPVGVDSQELIAREPSSAGDFFRRIRSKIKGAFQKFGKKIRSIGKRKQKKEKTSSPPVEAREQGVVFAREDADDFYVRGLDDEFYGREFDDDFEAREFDDEFEAREFDDELDAREPTRHQHPRELSYDTLD